MLVPPSTLQFEITDFTAARMMFDHQRQYLTELWQQGNLDDDHQGLVLACAMFLTIPMVTVHARTGDNNCRRR